MKKRIVYLLIAAFCLSLLAGCTKNQNESPAAVTSTVEAAKNYLHAMYKDKSEVTATDFERVSVVRIKGVPFDVTWTVDVAEGVTITKGEKSTKFDINEQTPVEIKYVITATIKDSNGKTETVSFNHIIPAYKETSWAEMAAAEKDSTLICTGVVTGIISKTNGNSSNCLYFQDADGGFYVYNMADDPVTLGIKVGMTVKVTGKKDTYSGTYEIVSAKAEITDETIKTVEAVDYTELYKGAETLKDEKLVEKQSLLVTLKGVELTKQDTTSGYYYFKLDGKESYIRISSSVCPIVKDKAAFTEAFAEHIGWIADVTGVICLYDGAFYLTPVDTNAINYIGMAEKTDAEKIDFEAEAIKFPTKYTADATVTLPTAGSSFDTVKATWAIEENEAATLADGVVTITVPKKDVTVKLTATFTCGEATKTVEYTFKVEAPADDLSEAEVLNKIAGLGEGEEITGTQVLKGKVKEITSEYSEKYDNTTFIMEVAGTDITVFRVVGGKDIAVGDEVVVTGVIKNYKGTIEFDAKCTYSKTLTVEEAKAAVVMDKAYALAENETMSGTQVLKGKVKEITTEYSEKYDNTTFIMEVAGKDITVFRVVGGKDIAVGDEVVVTGVIKNYKNTVEFDAKCTYSKTLTVEEAKAAVIMDKAYALGENEEMSGLQVLTGKVKEITTEYSEKYDNTTFIMEVAGKDITVFRVVGGKDIAVGDVVTVTGKIKNYKGTVEFDAKCTYTK